MYMTGLVIIVGAEVNAEIEHASPWGKAAGEKVPGERTKLGAAAARDFRERGSKKARPPAAAPTLPTPATTRMPARPGIGEWAAAFALRLVWPRLRRRHVSR
jgi:membrane protein